MTYINSLDIQSFRGISSLQLDQLSSINILTGDNNSGKTSVLEVIESYSNPESLKMWGTLLRKGSSASAYSFYEGFYDLFNINEKDKSIEYTIKSQDSISKHVVKERIRVDARIIDEEMTESEYNQVREIVNYAPSDSEEMLQRVGKMELCIRINDSTVAKGWVYEGQRRLDTASVGTEGKQKHNIVYIAPSSHTDADIYLTDILKYPNLYEEMLEILKDYDENIISINYDKGNHNYGKGIYKILSKSYQEALPLNVYGDGMKKAVLLMSAVLKAQDGILLLDEFETAIHTSAMSRTFRWILETCLKLNVQVFLTSHSKEAIDKVLKCSEKVRSRTAVYTLYRKKDKITVRRLFGNKALEVQDEMGLELR